MNQKNYHDLFITSTSTMYEALRTYQVKRKEIEDTKDAWKDAAAQNNAAFQQVREAEQVVEDAMDVLSVAVDTPDEEKAQAQLRKARLGLETAKDRHKAIVAKNPPAPELSAEELAVEAAEKLAIAHMVAEELNKLPEEALHTLHRAFAIYEGCMRWPAFLEFVLPSLDMREVPQLRAEVINEYGIG